MSSIAVITLIVLFFAAGGIYAGYRSVKQKLEHLSGAAFGTKSFLEGMERQADELAVTPKSVSGMTRIFEPQIQRDFPEFNLEQFKDKSENMLASGLGAITSENCERLMDASDDLRHQVENTIAQNRAEGVKETYANVRIHRTEITNYLKNQGKCIIVFQSAVEFFHYKEKNGTVTEGNRERLAQTKYNVELMYIQDAGLAGLDNAVGITCPNCGAPVTGLGIKYCEYCGLNVTPVNIKVWKIQNFYEVDYSHV